MQEGATFHGCTFSRKEMIDLRSCPPDKRGVMGNTQRQLPRFEDTLTRTSLNQFLREKNDDESSSFSYNNIRQQCPNNRCIFSLGWLQTRADEVVVFIFDSQGSCSTMTMSRVASRAVLQRRLCNGKHYGSFSEPAAFSSLFSNRTQSSTSKRTIVICDNGQQRMPLNHLGGFPTTTESRRSFLNATGGQNGGERKQGEFDTPEKILEECSQLYDSISVLNDKLGGMAIPPATDTGTSLPFCLLVGNHSSGKSSFINYLLKKDIQTAGVS